MDLSEEWGRMVWIFKKVELLGRTPAAAGLGVGWRGGGKLAVFHIVTIWWPQNIQYSLAKSHDLS